MALKTIPSAWCKEVCSILRTEDGSLIRFTPTAQQRFDADFWALEVWNYDLYQAIRQTLEQSNVQGCPIAMKPPPPGETWEFYFTLCGIKTYGKILLRKDRRGLLIHSAHLPQKEKLSCE